MQYVPGRRVSIKQGIPILPTHEEDPAITEASLDLSENARHLRALPENLWVRRLKLRGCSKLTELPAALRVAHLDITDCTGLTSLPGGLRCYELIAKGSGLTSLPAGLRVDFRLDLEGCTGLTELPAGLKTGTLILRGCTGLKALPEGLDVSFLDLEGCTRLVDWPRDATVRIGRLNLRGCTLLSEIPSTVGRLSQLDVAQCARLTSLPDGLEVNSWIDLAHSGLTSLPSSLAGVTLRWNRVPIDERIAFRPETLTVDEILAEENAELRRVMLERYGLDRFMIDAKAEVLDVDQDEGGERRLLHLPLEGDEPLVCVMVRCPSTGRVYMLRVPPTMTTCRQAVAWTAGFDNPDDYRPLVET